MSPRVHRATVAVVVAVALAALATGCDLVSQAKNVAGNVSALADIADKLKNAENLTYTAQYKTFGGDEVTIVQQPPNGAYIGPDGRFISTNDATYLCQLEAGKQTCQKAPGRNGIAAADAGTIAAVAGQGFVPPSLAVGLVGAASLYPKAKVETSTKQLAGQQATCAKVSNLEDAENNQQTIQDFTVCITDDGVLGSFDGALQDGSKANLELVSYTKTADATAFQPPAGATITDVQGLQPK